MSYFYEFKASYPREGQLDGETLVVATGYTDAERYVREDFGVYPTRLSLLGAVGPEPRWTGVHINGSPRQRVTLTGLGWLVATEVPS